MLTHAVFDVWVEATDRFGGVACSDGVGRDIARDHRRSTNDAIFADCDALAYSDSIAKPHVVFQAYRRAFSRKDAVVGIVPVSVSNKGAFGEHAVVAYVDADRGAQLRTRGEHAVVADCDVTLAPFVAASVRSEPESNSP